MDKALNYLALARKGGRAELGEEPVGAITRTGKGYLVIVASDASDHTWRRAKSFVAGTEQQCVRVPFTKEEIYSQRVQFGYGHGVPCLLTAISYVYPTIPHIMSFTI